MGQDRRVHLNTERRSFGVAAAGVSKCMETRGCRRLRAGVRSGLVCDCCKRKQPVKAVGQLKVNSRSIGVSREGQGKPTTEPAS
jgi:hypothetical protein